MATEHYEETILAAVKTALEAMTGSNYHYPVADDERRHVVRPVGYDEALFSRLGQNAGETQVLYAILLDATTHMEDTSEHVNVETRFDIVCLFAFEHDDEDPYSQPEPSRQKLQLRLEHDVERCLRVSLVTGPELKNLGDLENLEIINAEKDAGLVYHPDAAQVILRCVARYERHYLEP